MDPMHCFLAQIVALHSTLKHHYPVQLLLCLDQPVHHGDHVQPVLTVLSLHILSAGKKVIPEYKQ